MSRSRPRSLVFAVLVGMLWAFEAEALVVVRNLNIGYAGLGGVSAAAIDVTAGPDDILQFVLERPDYLSNPADDNDDYRTLMQRRLTTTDVWHGESRVDISSENDSLATVVPLADGFGFVWSTGAVEGGIAYRQLHHHGEPPFGPMLPALEEPTIVAGLAAASLGDRIVIVWNGPDGIKGRLLAPNGTPTSGVFLVAPAPAGLPDVAAVPEGGFVVGWFDFDTHEIKVRPFAPSELPLAEASVVLSGAVFSRVAVGDDGVGAVVGIRVPPDSLGSNGTVLVGRFAAATGAPVGGEIEVVTTTDLILPDLGFDLSGNFFVVWGRNDNGPPVGLQARPFGADGAPLSGPVTLSGAIVKGRVRTSRLADGTFVNAFLNSVDFPMADVISLCDPGSVCGDGVLVSTCERCDDGAANSDTTPDACRINCTLPRCGDGVIDGGESCDDGNTTSCDGCSPSCTPELGLMCGDGIVAPSGCGETCDDGNAVVGDGCAPTCALERIPGGGSRQTDCYTEWQVDNPANDPLRDNHGAFRAKQVCVDDDPRCDFDGGIAGTCTFHVAVCANNVDAASCVTPNRLAEWTLERPSAAQGAKKPMLGALRAALQGTVPATIVGPQGTDLCSPTADVVVPLRGRVGAWHAEKVVVKTRASLYDGTRDTDKLKLTCLPGL